MNEHSSEFPRTLPPRANLEHLRNEAKRQLRDLRQKDATAQLADAQLSVARQYGFPSWRKMKAYVDAVHDSGGQLIEAVRAGGVDMVRTILEGHPDLVNASADLEEHVVRPSDALSMRLVHLAVAEDRFDVVRLLVERGANLNARNADGRLPLDDCFELGRDRMTEFLLASGAEPDASVAAVCPIHDVLRAILERDPRQANDLRTGLSPMG